MTNDKYEVLAMRYAFRDGVTSEDTYYRFGLYKEEAKTFSMDYFFWVIRNEDRVILFDCGYTEARAIERGRTITASPGELLNRVGLAPEQIDHVVLSHMHWDHIGNVGLFPNATFSVARSEFQFWRGPYGHRPCLGLALGAPELEAVEELERTGRLFQIDHPDYELYPGVRIRTAPGHTPGQLIADVSTGSGSVVLASDALHYYDEMTFDRPFHVFTELAGMYETYELLRSLEARPGTTIIAGHDPEVTARFKHIEQGCIDLSKPRTTSVR